MMHTAKGNDIEAVVSPDLGMSLLDFSIGHVPILQKSRKKDFLHGRKGLGPLILPHFNQRPSFPSIPDEVMDLIPHVDYLKKNGVKDPFQHGIGRYAQWSAETRCTDTQVSVTGSITGTSEYQGVALKEIVGFDFTAFITYILSEGNLTVKFDITGNEPVTAGIHFYYRLPEKGDSRTVLSVEEIGKNDDESLFEFSDHQKDGRFYSLPLEGHIDTEFTPVREEGAHARYKLITPEYRLDTKVLTEGDPEYTFDSVVVFHPEGSDFVCIEPLSDGNPLTPRKKKFSGEIVLHPILQ
jgi:galactose mutarotase-like enzyme